LLPFWTYVGEALQLVRQWLRQSHDGVHRHRVSGAGRLEGLVVTGAHAVSVAVIEGCGAVIGVVYRVASITHSVLERVTPPPVRGLYHTAAHALGGALIAVIRLFARLHWRSVRRHLDDSEVRKNWAFLNLGVGLLRGLHADDVVTRGFGTIDHLDFRDWLGRHIVPDLVVTSSPYDVDGTERRRSLTLESPVSMLLYNSDFAFEDGDTRKPRLAAGVVAYTLLRLGVTFKGAALWAMQAGMGDTVFTPFYRVLQKRGVKFEFFRKVKQLHVSEGGKAVRAVTIARQAELVEGRAGYDPLVIVKGLECWPSAPHWDQLRDGAQYESDGVDFEAWCGPEMDSFELTAGQDYDALVLGISLGAFPYVCAELIRANAEWGAMVRNLGLVRTQSAQLWLDRTARELGWTEGAESPSVSCYDSSNFDVWFDLSHLIGREAWSDPAPRSLAYVNGCMRGAVPRGTPQPCDELDQRAANGRCEALAVGYLKDEAFRIYKSAAAPGSFDWDRLVDPSTEPKKGPARVRSQYTRANVQPSELYVQSLPGSGRYRLYPDDARFENLVLAGDWTWNSFGAGCVEGATISGMLAAHGISGSPGLADIVGLTFGHPRTPYDPRRRDVGRGTRATHGAATLL